MTADRQASSDRSARSRRCGTADAAADRPTVELLAAMRLASQALPIGGFSYSQGLETAIDRGWVAGEPDALRWLEELLALNVGRFDAPLLYALAQAMHEDDWSTAIELHELHLASRESGEQHAESLQMGYSLMKLLQGLHEAPPPAAGDRSDRSMSAGTPLLEASASVAGLPSFAASLPWAWALAGLVFGLSPAQTLTAWLWSWLENQVMGTLKAVPLGQQAGQRLMSRLLPRLSGIVAQAQHLPRERWSNHAPGFALAACWHETQYSRMFRS
ncbi:MAG TPA: urease accessory UreF family protein [Burkholderiaceae bacterium]|nr:urease accessory UreF family protein [Burkholderiaceae bacterium]